MCNEIKCAIQYTVDLINNNINRDVQTARRMCKHGCTGYVHIKLSHGLREEAPPQSHSFCHHVPEALARWQ